MATYECDACGMAVNASCAKCDVPLVDGSLTLDDGTVVQISKCPECEGKIKSPQCCGADMVADQSNKPQGTTEGISDALGKQE